MGVYCLIKDGKIKNVIVASLELAEKIKQEKNFDSIKERKNGEAYGKNFVYDSEIEKDYMHPKILEKRDAEI